MLLYSFWPLFLHILGAMLTFGAILTAVVLSFGYPARPRDPESRRAEEWSERANRKSLSELVREVS